MKKLILLCAMIGSVQIFGMDPSVAKTVSQSSPAMAGRPEQKPESWNLLPKEVQMLVIQALYTSDNPNEAIHAIIAMSRTNKALNQSIHGDIKNFTALMNLLAKKFTLGTRKDFAEKFNTAAAQRYIKVNSRLLKAIRFGDLDTVKTLINQENADPNFTSYTTSMFGFSNIEYNARMAISNAIHEKKNGKEILQFLFEKGMSPKFELPGIVTSYVVPTPEDVQKLLDQYANQ